jgi:Flp pilus assembly pilin Flp
MHKKQITRVIGRLSFINNRHTQGQALIEYVLISVILVLALIAAITFAGPAIGNVFSNTIYNALNRTTTPYKTFSAADYNDMSTKLASFTPATFPFKTNTPAAPTCDNMAGVWRTRTGPTTIPPTYVLTGCTP